MNIKEWADLVKANSLHGEPIRQQDALSAIDHLRSIMEQTRELADLLESEGVQLTPAVKARIAWIRAALSNDPSHLRIALPEPPPGI